MKKFVFFGLATAMFASFAGHVPALADAGHGRASTVGNAGDPAHASRTIHVDMTDNEFSIENLDVKPGETIKFMLTNSGEFLHEFNIGTKDMHAGHQEEMMAMMDKGMLTTEKMTMPMAHNDPNSVLLEPGHSAELVWTFPQSAKLEFACNVPGHYESGMVGHIHFSG